MSGMCISRGIGQVGAARSARYLHHVRTMRSAKVRIRIPIAVVRSHPIATAPLFGPKASGRLWSHAKTGQCHAAEGRGSEGGDRA